jgi:hypothetical protein
LEEKFPSINEHGLQRHFIFLFSFFFKFVEDGCSSSHDYFLTTFDATSGPTTLLDNICESTLKMYSEKCSLFSWFTVSYSLLIFPLVSLSFGSTQKNVHYSIGSVSYLLLLFSLVSLFLLALKSSRGTLTSLE